MSLLQRVTQLARQYGPTVAREVQKYARSRQSEMPSGGPDQSGPDLPKQRRQRPKDQASGPAEPAPAGAGIQAPAGAGIQYAPDADGEPDAGEVVWAWVEYEDDPSQGKDRPVVLIGKRGNQWMGLYLTSQDNTRDATDEARYGRYWMDIGTGAWDRKGRPSEVRLDRLLLLDESAIRREGSALDRQTFDAVLAQARERGAL